MNEKNSNWLLQVAFKWSKLSGDLLSKLQVNLNGLTWLEMRCNGFGMKLMALILQLAIAYGILNWS